MINFTLNPNEPVQIWKIGLHIRMAKIAYFAKMISNTFRLVDTGHDPTHGIWNDPVYLVCQHIILSEFTDSES